MSDVGQKLAVRAAMQRGDVPSAVEFLAAERRGQYSTLLRVALSPAAMIAESFDLTPRSVEVAIQHANSDAHRVLRSLTSRDIDTAIARPKG